MLLVNLRDKRKIANVIWWRAGGAAKDASSVLLGRFHV